ncbi:type II asparaginase [Myroides sp. LJL119]
MKKLFAVLCVLFLNLPGIAQNQKVNLSEKPRIIILATGGTIAGSGESSTKAAYTAGKIPVETLIEAVPQMQNYAQVKAEQIAQIGSQDMNIETWLKLSNRINEIFEKDLADGVVVTHGTDTQEETAYFLDLTVASNKPVVVVGAMRAATAMSQDGNRNLLDAVIVAASKNSQQVGVVVAMNEYVFTARDVTKQSTTNMATFGSRNFGPIGLVFDNKVNYYYKTLKGHGEKFDVKGLETLPEVDIYYGYAGASDRGIKAAIKDKVKGIVYAGVGNGNFNQAVTESLKQAVDSGIVVCRSARAGQGKVTLDNEVDDKKLGFVVADDLSPQKARILLMLGLTKTDNIAQIQEMFFSY